MDDHVLDPAGARALCDLTSRLVAAPDASLMSGAIAETAHGVVGAAYAQLGLLSSEGDALVLYHGEALDVRAQEEWPVVPLDLDTPVTRVVASGLPLAFSTAAALIDEFPLVRAATEASGYESVAVVPIFDPLQWDRCAGTLSVAWHEPGRAGDRALELLADVAERCALALAKIDRWAARAGAADGERSAVLALQESLLPSIRFDDPHLAVASRYVASAHDLVVGGDWFDTVPLPDGRVAVAIGDVAGHGWDAALAMGQIRTDFEALAAHHRGPNDLLEEIDRYAEQRDALMTTAAVVYVDAARSSLTSVVAGHPPPILVHDATADVLDHALGPPLGTNLGRRTWPTGTITPIRRDDTLVLYTDGLIERRGEGIDRGIERLRDLAASQATDDLETLCDDLMDSMLGGAEPQDDVALLVVRVH